MKITNKHNLPEAFVRAVVNDPYDRGDSDFSATSLSEPPRVNALKLKFGSDLSVDASTKVASIIGQGAHSIAERAGRNDIDIVEKRYFMEIEVDGFSYSISAQIDLYETDTEKLYDWKTTKAYAFSKKAGSGKKPEWITQMNIGAEIMRANGLNPKSLHIIAMLKDWNIREAGSAGMPETEVVAVDLPMMTSEEVRSYITERIKLHVAAREKLPLCSSSDNWAGRKCEQWCDVNSVCEQYKNQQKTGIVQKE